MGYITFALVSDIPLSMSLVQKSCTRGTLTHNPSWLSHYDRSYPGVWMIVPILPTYHFIHQGVLGTNYIPDRLSLHICRRARFLLCSQSFPQPRSTFLVQVAGRGLCCVVWRAEWCGRTGRWWEWTSFPTKWQTSRTVWIYERRQTQEVRLYGTYLY